MTAPDTTRPMRADARRNRERLLAAAAELFADQGHGVALDAIARRAGVGIGTLYRHFPTRDALVEELYRHEVELLAGSADELLATLAPDRALGGWLDRYVEYVAAKRGMIEVLRPVAAARSALYPETRAQIRGAIARLLAAGQAAGTLRGDLDADDVHRAIGGIWLIDGPEFRAQAARLLGLVMDGLRTV
jgi:AcrR family transcriptional regulator